MSLLQLALGSGTGNASSGGSGTINAPSAIYGEANYNNDFNYTSLQIAGTGANNANNNSFVDSSTNNFTITSAGGATQGTETSIS